MDLSTPDSLDLAVALHDDASASGAEQAAQAKA
jgi:hypothetical protein